MFTTKLFTWQRAIGLIALVVLLLTPQFTQITLAQSKSDSKVSQQLLALARGSAAQTLRSDLRPLSPTVRDGKVLIDAVAAGDVADLEADLKRLGMEGTAAFGRICSGWLPISACDDLNDLSSLRFARASLATTNVGLTTSGGDSAMRSDLARSEFEVDGSGILLGVLSDSYDQGGIGGSAAADVASGDLPPGVSVLDDTAFCGGPCTDEGRAMMQLAFDVAPGSNFSFHTAFNGQADFALGIEELAGCPPGSAAGCVPSPNPADVIVDDVIYFAEPMFQDGIIAQAVDVVEGAGNAYFSSAGNNDRRSYESPFAADGSFGFGAFPPVTGFAPPFFGGIAHDFGGGDFCQSLTLPGGSTIILSFQWSESFFSVTGVPFSGSSLADYDIYIMLEVGGVPVGVINGGVDDNIFGTGDAVEVTGVTLGGGSPLPLCLMLVEFAKLGDDGVIGASGTDLLKYVRFGSSSVTVNEFDTMSGTTYGHSNAAGAEAVGAARYTETPVFGVDPPLIEFFSSAGTTPILFNVDGTVKAAPEIRVKPGVTGPDGGNTTFFFPSSLDLEGDGFPNFFGTSASAPHVAGVAALLLEACNEDDDCSEEGGGLTPAEIHSFLRSTATDMDDPFTAGFDVSFDEQTGFGFVDACEALAALRGEDDDECGDDDDDDDEEGDDDDDDDSDSDGD